MVPRWALCLLALTACASSSGEPVRWVATIGDAKTSLQISRPRPVDNKDNPIGYEGMAEGVIYSRRPLQFTEHTHVMEGHEIAEAPVTPNH
eukprot:evm.model.scf_332.8 EVM.evm.TU.scf_332.8   scf_332:89502-91435(+)